MAPSRNGYSFTGTLLINNFPVCIAEDRGDGGSWSFRVLNQRLFNEWEKELEALPMVSPFGIEIPVDKEIFIDLLHYALENKKPFTLNNVAA